MGSFRYRRSTTWWSNNESCKHDYFSSFSNYNFLFMVFKRTLFGKKLMNSSQTNKPFGLYIHIPFCQTKCPYCDFNTYQQSESHIPKTMNAIKTSLEKWSSILNYKNLSTIFFWRRHSKLYKFRIYWGTT